MTTEEFEINDKCVEMRKNYKKICDLLFEVKKIINNTNNIAASIVQTRGPNPYIALENVDYCIIEEDLPIKLPTKIMSAYAKKWIKNND